LEYANYDTYGDRKFKKFTELRVKNGLRGTAGKNSHSRSMRSDSVDLDKWKGAHEKGQGWVSVLSGWLVQLVVDARLPLNKN
jgi:hypothetical protein